MRAIRLWSVKRIRVMSKLREEDYDALEEALYERHVQYWDIEVFEDDYPELIEAVSRVRNAIRGAEKIARDIIIEGGV